jgi:short-subunit dehydrogenase involved in D-alanine esterification of teichoic acids
LPKARRRRSVDVAIETYGQLNVLANNAGNY